MLFTQNKAMNKCGKIFLALSFLVGLMSVNAPAYASDISVWSKKVSRHISRKLVYPKSAMRRGVEGEARVRVTVDRSGNIVTSEIIKPSGEKILDKSIEKSLARFTPLPTPPASMSEKALTFVIPLIWG